MRDKVDFSALRNAERTGFDRLDLRAGEQGLFFKRLALEDLSDALARVEDHAERASCDRGDVGMRRFQGARGTTLRRELLSRAGRPRVDAALHAARADVRGSSL